MDRLLAMLAVWPVLGLILALTVRRGKPAAWLLLGPLGIVFFRHHPKRIPGVRRYVW